MGIAWETPEWMTSLQLGRQAAVRFYENVVQTGYYYSPIVND